MVNLNRREMQLGCQNGESCVELLSDKNFSWIEGKKLHTIGKNHIRTEKFMETVKIYNMIRM